MARMSLIGRRLRETTGGLKKAKRMSDSHMLTSNVVGVIRTQDVAACQVTAAVIHMQGTQTAASPIANSHDRRPGQRTTKKTVRKEKNATPPTIVIASTATAAGWARQMRSLAVPMAVVMPPTPRFA